MKANLILNYFSLDSKLSKAHIVEVSLFLLLSGETEENKLGIIQGQSNTKLSNIGIEQAKKVGEKLSTIRFDYVFTSDLNRAYEVFF